jgi:hypothetical protein
MSLRKSPVMTPAGLAASRANALESAGPNTARGNAWSPMNGLKDGCRSRLFLNFMWTMYEAPPYSEEETTAAILIPEQARLPLFANMLELFRRAETDTVPEFRARRRGKSRKKDFIRTKLECN